MSSIVSIKSNCLDLTASIWQETQKHGAITSAVAGAALFFLAILPAVGLRGKVKAVLVPEERWIDGEVETNDVLLNFQVAKLREKGDKVFVLPHEGSETEIRNLSRISPVVYGALTGLFCYGATWVVKAAFSFSPKA